MTLLLPPPADGPDSFEQFVRDISNVTYRASHGERCPFCDAAGGVYGELNTACPIVRARRLIDRLEGADLQSKTDLWVARQHSSATR